MRLKLDPAVLRAANISPETGLATDYLNHFNEAAMLVSMVDDSPELARDILEWRPLGYADHFHNTCFKDRDLAVAAYQEADPELIERFQKACSATEAAIERVQLALAGDRARRLDIATETAAIFALIARVGAIINGLDVRSEAPSRTQA